MQKLLFGTTARHQSYEEETNDTEHSFSTTNLITHLKSRQLDLNQLFVKQKEKNVSVKPCQENILESFEKSKKFSNDHPKVKAPNRKIIEMISRHNQPFRGR